MIKLCLSAVILCILTASINANVDCGLIKVDKRIVKGDHAYRGQFPWIASLYNANEKYICGSSIISRFHLLTAAHCVEGDIRGYYGLLGLYDLSNEDEHMCLRRNIANASIHKDYKPHIEYNRSNGDIAVLRLFEMIQYTNHIQPICLPVPTTNVDGIYGIVGGYGKALINGVYQNLPSFVSLKTISSRDCKDKGDIYSKIVSDRSFCAGNGDYTPCKGDSGDAFLVHNQETDQHTIYGVVSLATGRCMEKDYVIFIDVPKYIGWIEKQIR